ncbi:MAG: hypothetical protein ACE366_16445 [Bradymonadia bacterium]
MLDALPSTGPRDHFAFDSEERQEEHSLEAVTLPSPSGDGVLLGDDVAKAGLDPDLYHAVLPAELGRAGRVTKNGKLYLTSDYIEHCAKLNEMASKSMIPGLDGHVYKHRNLDKFRNVALRLLSVETEELDDGSVVAKGRIGLLKTSTGTDVFVCWKAGLPLGMSQDSMVWCVPHKIDEESPYWAANQDHAGKVVKLSRIAVLKGFDVVRFPGADTFVMPADAEEALESAFERVLERVTESAPELTITTPSPSKDTAPSGGDDTPGAVPAQEAQMTEEEFKTKHPELFNAVVQKAQESAPKPDPMTLLDEADRDALVRFKGLNPTQRALTEKAMEAITSDEPAESAEKALEAVRLQADVDRTRLAKAEQEAETARESAAAAQKAAEEANAQLAQLKLEQGTRRALEAWAGEDRVMRMIAGRVQSAVESGALTSVEAAQSQATADFKLVEDAKALSPAKEAVEGQNTLNEGAPEDGKESADVGGKTPESGQESANPYKYGK